MGEGSCCRNDNRAWAASILVMVPPVFFVCGAAGPVLRAVSRAGARSSASVACCRSESTKTYYRRLLQARSPRAAHSVFGCTFNRDDVKGAATTGTRRLRSQRLWLALEVPR